MFEIAVFFQPLIIAQWCTPLPATHCRAELLRDFPLIVVSSVLNEHEFGFCLSHAGIENSS
jgi:hypothetical protein